MAGQPKQTIRNDYSSTNVTTSAWVELDAALNEGMSEIEIFDSSGQTMELSYGPAAGSEANLLYIVPGGNGRMPLTLAKGARLAIQAVSGNATGGELIINLWG